MLFNQARAIHFMKEHNLDVLVATSPVNITYFTDYSYWLDSAFKEYMCNPGASSNRAQSFAVFPIAGEPALVLGAQSAINAADLRVNDLQVYGDPGLDYSFPCQPHTDLEKRFIHLASREATPCQCDRSIDPCFEESRPGRCPHWSGNGRSSA